MAFINIWLLEVLPFQDICDICLFDKYLCIGTTAQVFSWRLSASRVIHVWWFFRIFLGDDSLMIMTTTITRSSLMDLHLFFIFQFYYILILRACLCMLFQSTFIWSLSILFLHSGMLTVLSFAWTGTKLELW